jgi:hypothetical protein
LTLIKLSYTISQLLRATTFFNDIKMNNKNSVNLKTAAELCGISPSLLIYYLETYGEPRFEIVAGNKVFDPSTVKEWNKRRKANA